MRYGLLNDIRALNEAVLKQTVQRYVAYACQNNPQIPPVIPFTTLKADVANQSHLLDKFGLKLDKPVCCMMHCAEYGPAKQWPVEYYKQLAESLVEHGWQIWLPGSDKDKAACKVISENRGVYNLCGTIQLIDTFDLLSCAKSVVSNDSGLMHVAAAVGVEVNVIYGSSTPEYAPPLTTEVKKNVFYLGLGCSPCFKRECPLGYLKCMNGIYVVDILNKIYQKC